MRGSGRFRNGIIWLLVFVAVGALLYNFMPTDNTKTIALTEMAGAIRAGQVAEIRVNGDELRIKRDGSQTEVVAHEVVAHKEREASIFDVLDNLGVTEQVLEEQNVEIIIEDPSRWGGLMTLASGVLPLLFFGGLIFFMMRQARVGGGQALSFGKSKARMFSGDKPTVTFEDVAGVEEAKQELAEVIDFLREPEKFIALGARIPKGVLMVGPPGCGKTLMARAVAGEADVPFFSISGSEFVEMFVRLLSLVVRDLFDQAKKHSPCIVFIDEIDAVGRHRGAGLGGSHDEREQTLNQILVEMDGFDTDTNVIIIAATNRPDILDPALLRPGRVDRRVVVDRPHMKGRRKILEIHARGKPLGRDVELDVIAKQTPGFSGADLENLVNEAAILAARRDGKSITMEDFEEATEKVLKGPERKNRVISDEEREIIAYHEAGHALVLKMLPNTDPVHKITIVSRGSALGYVRPLPERDEYLHSTAKLKDEIAVSLGGRVAEELVFGDMTNGANEDLERVTKTARSMVTQYGMSEALGPLQFGDRDELVFLGKEIGEQRNYSDAMAELIDAEVRRIVAEAYECARELLSEHEGALHRIAQHLMDVETMSGEELDELLAPLLEPAPAGQAGAAPTPA
ncbi:MAG: ATP-dependent zinc metalloprotease FtsH [Anaerolineales bacterium]|nr:ATP-dependent zinc metalloprotease FtsH [Anaerolineales bacterium]